MKKINPTNKKILSIFLRYLILLIIAFNLNLIYKILTPLTINSVSFLLKLVYPVIVSGIRILINQTTIIDIVPACIAGSAYLLLLILNLSISLKTKQRIYSIILSLALLLAFNTLRIFIFSILLVNDFKFFELTHKIFWYGISVILVIGIWFLIVKLFKIKQIPIVSDVKYILKNTSK